MMNFNDSFWAPRQTTGYGRDGEFAAEPDNGPSAGSPGWPMAAICMPLELAVPAKSGHTREVIAVAQRLNSPACAAFRAGPVE